MEHFEDLSKKAESGITSEQHELLDSAVAFAEYLTHRWPQIDSGAHEGMEGEPRVNYYLSGSLATMLLARSDKFVEMDEAHIPLLHEVRTREIPESARNIFGTFARQIGDLDYAPLDHYKANPGRLKKGGGGPSFDEVPAKARQVLQQGENQCKVMCDPVASYGAQRLAKIQVEGKDYYIARPDTIFAYKVLHLLQSYSQKPEKFNTDFKKIQEALREMYSEVELQKVMLQVLVAFEDVMEAQHASFYDDREDAPVYEKKIVQYIEKVLAHEKVSPEIRAILNPLRKPA